MLARWKEGAVLFFGRGFGCNGEMDAAAEEHARLMAWVEEQKERRRQLTDSDQAKHNSEGNTTAAPHAQKGRLPEQKNEQLRGSPCHTPKTQGTQHSEGRAEVDIAVCNSMPRTSTAGAQLTEDARGPCIGGLPEDELDAALHDALGVPH
jgi:hypothetical protein